MSEQKQCPQCLTFFEGRKNKIYCSEKCKLDFFFEQRNQGVPLKRDSQENILALQLQIQREKQAHEEKMKLLELQKLGFMHSASLSTPLQTSFKKIMNSLLKASGEKVPKKFFQEKVSEMEKWIKELMEIEEKELKIKYPEYELVAYFLHHFKDALQGFQNPSQKTFLYELEEKTIHKTKQLLDKN